MDILDIISRWQSKGLKVSGKNVCSFFKNFDAAAVEEGEVQEVNYRILIKVCAAAPVRLEAVAFEPVRYEKAKILEGSIGYLDYVGSVKLLAGSKAAYYF